MPEITFLGHACFLIEEGDTRLLIDPFLTGNPKAAKEAGLGMLVGVAVGLELANELARQRSERS